MTLLSAHRILLPFLLALVSVFSLSCEEAETETAKKIESGTSFGECLGFCFSKMTIEGTKVDYTESGWDKEHRYLEESIEGSITGEEWDSLNVLLDMELFRSLDDVIGCPDCRDQGAEWIRVEEATSVKEVRFEYGQSIGGMEAFLGQIRAIRERFHDELFPVL